MRVDAAGCRVVGAGVSGLPWKTVGLAVLAVLSVSTRAVRFVRRRVGRGRRREVVEALLQPDEQVDRLDRARVDGNAVLLVVSSRRVLVVDEASGALVWELPRAGAVAAYGLGTLAFVGPSGGLWLDSPEAWPANRVRNWFNETSAPGEYDLCLGLGLAPVGDEDDDAGVVVATTGRIAFVGPARGEYRIWSYDDVLEVERRGAALAVLARDGSARRDVLAAAGSLAEILAERIRPAAARSAMPGPPPSPAALEVVASTPSLGAPIGDAPIEAAAQFVYEGERLTVVLTDRTLLIFGAGLEGEVARQDILAAAYDVSTTGDRLVLRTRAGLRSVPTGAADADGLAIAHELHRSGVAAFPDEGPVSLARVTTVGGAIGHLLVLGVLVVSAIVAAVLLARDGHWPAAVARR